MKELESLNKAIEQAGEVLQKSHVKGHTRTSASGTVSQVKEHEDSRKAAMGEYRKGYMQAKQDHNNRPDSDTRSKHYGAGRDVGMEKDAHPDKANAAWTKHRENNPMDREGKKVPMMDSAQGEGEFTDGYHASLHERDHANPHYNAGYGHGQGHAQAGKHKEIGGWGEGWEKHAEKHFGDEKPVSVGTYDGPASKQSQDDAKYDSEKAKRNTAAVAASYEKNRKGDHENLDTFKLEKSIHDAEQVLAKSHVKGHTRTSKSGAVSQVKAYDDKRTKAQEAGKFAEKTQAANSMSNPRDIRGVAANHADAAHAHVDALRHASTNEQINEHYHAASRHFQANDSMHTYANADRTQADNTKHQRHATMSSDHANELSEHAKNAADSEDTSEGLNKKSSLHVLAMEQHQRAHAAHMKVANEHYNDRNAHKTPESEHNIAMTEARYHQDKASEHGKEVQRISHLAIDASDKAREATTKAANSKKPEDHKAAAEAHRKAAKLDWDSETGPAHTRWAEQHEEMAKGDKKKDEGPYPNRAYLPSKKA